MPAPDDAPDATGAGHTPPADGLPAEDLPVDDLPALLSRVETALLGGPREYTRFDVAERSGVELDSVRALWRALGFAVSRDDDRNFTDADVASIQQVRRLREIGDIDDDLMLAMTRIIGQTFARLASWQGQLVLEIISRQPELLAEPDELVGLIDELTPLVGELHDYVWRRQLAAVFARMASNSGATTGATTSMVVGFVDMAGYTSLTRRSSESELRDVLTAFESVATDIVGQHGGQIVKTIGDEILFVADDPLDGTEIALCLLEAAADNPVLPQVRAGLAYGPVVRRLGDVYGATVNIASRLTSLARTDSVLVDDGLSERLRADDRYTLRSLRPASVRGYNHLHSWRLRRAGG